MGGLSLGERRRLVDGGADEWVAEFEPVATDVHEPGLLGPVKRIRRGSELRGRGDHGRKRAAVVGGRHQ